MTTAESAISEIRKKADIMNAYAEVLESLSSQEHWYMHEDEETGVLVDDTSDYAANHLTAIRNAIAAVKSLAGA